MISADATDRTVIVPCSEKLPRPTSDNIVNLDSNIARQSTDYTHFLSVIPPLDVEFQFWHQIRHECFHLELFHVRSLRPTRLQGSPRQQEWLPIQEPAHFLQINVRGTMTMYRKDPSLGIPIICPSIPRFGEPYQQGRSRQGRRVRLHQGYVQNVLAICGGTYT